MAISTLRAVLLSGAASALLHRFAPAYSPLNGFVSNFLLFASVAVLLLFVYNVILYPKLLSPLRHLPHPKGGSFINGHFWDIFSRESGAPLRDFMKDVPNEGLILYRHLLNSERIFITSPKALAEVLVTRNYEFIKPSFFRVNLGRLLGNGILFAEGDEHKKQRRHLLPAFSYRHIKDLYPIFWSKAREVTELMTQTVQAKSDSKDDHNVLEVGGWASRVTLDIIGVAGMGHDFNATKDPESELNRCYRSVFQFSGGARFIQILGFLFGLEIVAKLPMKRNRQIVAARALIRRVCYELIDEKRQKLEKGITGKDILSVAIESGSFDDEDLANQLMTFLAAGHETTASAMSWACYLLCRHPDIQKRLREEIRANLPSISDPSVEITAADVDKVAYLHAVCNEILRVFPPVPLTVRVAAHDTMLLGQPVPKGTTIVTCPWAINISTELWGPDAEEFNPDRWMGAGKANTGGADSNYSFLTFIHGPRSCIGQAFAKAEFACLLASWAGRFEMEFENKDYVLNIGGGITARPKGGLRVRMKPVEGW